ncbi:MAG TPA: diaminopimelate epimerase [Bacteroidales bacterium]|nr:diaminopimelate epimerase [Bacteroidales bacterium]
MNLAFEKYQGAGNDFIFFEARWKDYFDASGLAALCDRHFGVGADGVIFLSPPEKGVMNMHYFNSDGRESTMCGNGGRCAAAYAYRKGWVNSRMSILAADGLHQAIVIRAEGKEAWVELEMRDAPVPGHTGDGFFIDTGSPHHVIFVRDVSNIDLRKEGAAIRYSSTYAPGGTNVDFVAVKDPFLEVRTYERGVEDETLACGTGATAVAMVNAYRQKLQGPCLQEIHMPGGILQVRFDFDGHNFRNVWLCGPAIFVFEGRINPMTL